MTDQVAVLSGSFALLVALLGIGVVETRDAERAPKNLERSSRTLVRVERLQTSARTASHVEAATFVEDRAGFLLAAREELGVDT